jgi:biopolymer transport protein TolR
VAGVSRYQDDDEDDAITDINVTPFVDVLLVLLVVFIVTAKLIVARGVVVDKPKEAHGGEFPATLRVSVTENGDIYVGADKFTNDDAAVARIKELVAASPQPKAVIAGDRKTAHGRVMHAIELVSQAAEDLHTTVPIGLENERPR